MRTLPFEEGDFDCACDLANHEGHGICPKLIEVKAGECVFHEKLKKVMKTVFKACYLDLGHEIS